MTEHNYDFKVLTRLTAIDQVFVIQSMINILKREAILNIIQTNSFNSVKIISDFTDYECVHFFIIKIYLMYEL